MKDNIQEIVSESGIVIENKTAHHKDVGLVDVEYLPLKAAMKKYPQYKDKLWNLVAKDKNDITKEVFAEGDTNGIFVLAKKGSKNIVPLKTCFLINQNDLDQKIHNLFVVEEGAELHIVSGCSVDSKSKKNFHKAVTEMYVGIGATLTYTMIHDWNKDTEVLPVTAIKQEEDSVYMSNYITFEAVKRMKSCPTVVVGKNAKCFMNSVIFAPRGSYYDVGGKVILEGEGSSADIISRNVTSGGTVIMPAIIESKAGKTKGHIECSALMLEEDSILHAIPELKTESPDAELTHEAAIGKISQDELNYLMSRGLTEEEAQNIIIRGFLNIEIQGLPESIIQQIQKATEMVEKKGF